ncbi:hypothetical protein [Hymenobacter psoromatis]|uniref:hypothetical protein n=1 Tax=Hymenobacter psoromatis TaxID=1484116 RepID=UPI001CC159AC|nr:hypothetical protein [Hymenobacter psoromatis]
MASPHLSSSVARQYRRSSFNGAKQLKAASAPTYRILVVVGLLVAALVGTLAVVAYALATSPK